MCVFSFCQCKYASFPRNLARSLRFPLSPVVIGNWNVFQFDDIECELILKKKKYIFVCECII